MGKSSGSGGSGTEGLRLTQVIPLVAMASCSRSLYSWGDRPGGSPPTNRETRGAAALLSLT